MAHCKERADKLLMVVPVAVSEPAMPSYYHIRVRGALAPHWSVWFDNMTITNQPNGETLLCGTLADQSA